MTDDEVLTALDAFIAGFDTTDRSTQEPRSPNSKRETLIDKGSQKERKEREKEDGSREDPYIQDLGTLGSNTQKPRHSCGFRWSPREAHEAPKAEMRWHLDHGERVPRDICAGCRRSITPGKKALDLADDNRVHLADGYECLIPRREVAPGGARSNRGFRERVTRRHRDRPAVSSAAGETVANGTLASDQSAAPRP